MAASPARLGAIMSMSLLLSSSATSGSTMLIISAAVSGVGTVAAWRIANAIVTHVGTLHDVTPSWPTCWPPDIVIERQCRATIAA